MIKGNFKAQGGHSGRGGERLTIQKRQSQRSEDCLIMEQEVKEDKGSKGEQIHRKTNVDKKEIKKKSALS